jgi:hypothetical protein
MMRRHDDPAIQTAYEAWNDAVLDQADHRIGCEAGCSILGDVCDVGRGYAAREQDRWRAFQDARRVEVAS